MRHILILTGIALAAWTGSPPPALAAPFCLIGPSGHSCSYHTWAQCLASVAGGRQHCALNYRGPYVFDVSNPANPRVVSAAPNRKASQRQDRRAQ